MTRTPLIAVPAHHFAPGALSGWRPGGFAVGETYVAALKRAGARPIILTAPDEAPAAEILAPFDGVLLTGGGDLDPGIYGAPAHPANLDQEPERDVLELAFVHAAIAAGKPLLGICRGFQAINVALGGTLHQHLPDLGMVEHGNPHGGGGVSHELRIDLDSRLGRLVGAPACHGIARHHQGVDHLGEGLRPTAWTSDGLVEGLETSDGWVVAVQWHPEVTAGEDPTQQALFDGLVGAVRRTMVSGRTG